jgi:hypothetical protein
LSSVPQNKKTQRKQHNTGKPWLWLLLLRSSALATSLRLLLLLLLHPPPPPLLRFASRIDKSICLSDRPRLLLPIGSPLRSDSRVLQQRKAILPLPIRRLLLLRKGRRRRASRSSSKTSWLPARRATSRMSSS